jgi:hypothetical protein
LYVFQQRLGLLPHMLLQLAQAHDLPHRLHIIAGRLGLTIDILDVVRDALFLFLQPLDALDEKAQLVGGYIALAHGVSLW